MWYLVLSRSLPHRNQQKQLNLAAHRRWLEDQHRSGKVLFSGPTSDLSYGIYVLLAANLAEARALAANDPDHVIGVASVEVLEWNAHRAFRLDGPSITDVERLATEGA